MKVLALTDDGRMTYCSVPEEKRGQGRCNHVSHQNDNESTADFARRAEETNGKLELHKKNVEEFQFALTELDKELESLNLPKPMEIKAIGGFALMSHNIRKDGYTVDIDTITDDYDENVRNAINRVGEQLSLEKDWINNEAAAGDTEYVTQVLDAVYLRQDYGLKNIQIDIADVPTLTRAKAIAVDDNNLSGRTRDWDDLIDLMNHQDIKSKEEFAKAYPEIEEWEHPRVHQAIGNYFSTGSNDFTVEEEDLDMDALMRELEEESDEDDFW